MYFSSRLHHYLIIFDSNLLYFLFSNCQRMKKYFVIFFLQGISLFIFSQTVVFTDRTDLLNTVSGFTSYSDCALDMNGDYLDDVVRVGGKGVFIDYQQQDGSFIQKPFHLPILSTPSWSICGGDIDNNGYNDLLFADSESASFFKANHNATAYEEILMPGKIESQRSNLADINNDGWLDGFICNETVRSVPYRNTGEGNMIADTDLILT